MTLGFVNLFTLSFATCELGLFSLPHHWGLESNEIGMRMIGVNYMYTADGPNRTVRK